jgi:hypothetical protein
VPHRLRRNGISHQRYQTSALRTASLDRRLVFSRLKSCRTVKLVAPPPVRPVHSGCPPIDYCKTRRGLLSLYFPIKLFPTLITSSRPTQRHSTVSMLINPKNSLLSNCHIISYHRSSTYDSTHVYLENLFRKINVSS